MNAKTTGSWVYWKSAPELWAVGFYSIDGDLHTDSIHDSLDEAVAKVHCLNEARFPLD